MKTGMTQRFWLFVGASGAGKSTIANWLKDTHGFEELVSHTTRPPRPGEVNGVDYHFITKKDVQTIDFAERATYSGHDYGITLSEVNAKLGTVENLLAVVNREGCEAILSLYPNQVEVVYIQTDAQTLKARLEARGESETAIKERLAHAHHHREFNNEDIATYIIDNRGSLREGYAQIEALLALTQAESA